MRGHLKNASELGKDSFAGVWRAMLTPLEWDGRASSEPIGERIYEQVAVLSRT